MKSGVKSICKALSITIPILLASNTVLASTNFKDVTEKDWFNKSVNQLTEKKIVCGFEDSTFKPLDNVKTGEFIKMLITAMGVDVKASTNGHWAMGYYSMAVSKGLIVSNEITNKDLDTDINRGQMARMLVRSLGNGVGSNLEQYKTQIKDYDSIPYEFKDYVLRAYALGLITGYEDNTFKYDSILNRAEASEVIVRYINIKEKQESTTKSNVQTVVQTSKSTNTNTQSNSGNVTTSLSEYSLYEYPMEGREYELGPENTMCIKNTYYSNGKLKYMEVLREADMYVLARQIPKDGQEIGGDIEYFLPAPPLSQEAIDKWAENYDPVKVKEKQDREKAEAKEKNSAARKAFKDKLVENNTLTIISNDSYIIESYKSPVKDIALDLSHIGGWRYFDQSDLKSKEYTEDNSLTVQNIKKGLDNVTFNKILTVKIVPYICDKYPNGLTMVDDSYDSDSAYTIILFNNSTSLIEQFNIQLEEFKKVNVKD